jgi:transcriptional regulator with XRE-family HTH domain
MEEQQAQQRSQAIRRKMAGARMRALRQQFEVGVEECAQALGLTPGGIGERELGRRPLLVGEFWRLCGYLGVRPGEFFEVAKGPRGRLPPARRLRLQRKMLGAALAEGRDSRGWSRSEAAVRGHISEERLGLCELGQEELAVADAEALAELYGIGASCLTVGAGDPVEQVSEAAGREQGVEAAAGRCPGLPPDLAELLDRPEVERYLRAAMALSQLSAEALASLEDALFFLRAGE